MDAHHDGVRGRPRAATAGFDHYLGKTADSVELLELLRMIRP